MFWTKSKEPEQKIICFDVGYIICLLGTNYGVVKEPVYVYEDTTSFYKKVTWYCDEHCAKQVASLYITTCDDRYVVKS